MRRLKVAKNIQGLWNFELVDPHGTVTYTSLSIDSDGMPHIAYYDNDRGVKYAHWPGNIRELENAIERAVLLTEGPKIIMSDLRLGELSTTPSGDASPVVRIPPTGIALEEVERQALVEALKMSNWVQKDAAELLAISPRVMNYKIKTVGIQYPRGRRPMALEAAG